MTLGDKIVYDKILIRTNKWKQESQRKEDLKMELNQRIQGIFHF